MRFKAWIVTNMDGSRYLVRDEDGAIVRTDMEFYPSDTWLVTYVYEAKAFGNLLMYRPEGKFSLDWREQFAALAKLDEITFKNRKPRYFLGDFDHGTRRTQMVGIRQIKGPFLYTLNTRTKRFVTVQESLA